MKAAVLKQYGENPQYTEVAEPVVANSNQILVTPLASSIKQLDKGKASGQHYTNFGQLPAIVGMDGVVRLPDGQLAYAMGLDGKGLMAEKALVDKRQLCLLPTEIDPALAAAMPNTLMGSDVAMVRRGHIKAGDVVFVNGATGNTGLMAVQMAKYRGASFVIATGRNPEKLALLKKLGADQVISLKQTDEAIISELMTAYKAHPFDIILDYVWGKPAELVFAALKSVSFEKQVKYITIGNMAGAEIPLASQLLRSRDLILMGSGIGSSLAQEDIAKYMAENASDVFKYAAAGHLTLLLNKFPLQEISKAWESDQAVVMIEK